MKNERSTHHSPKPPFVHHPPVSSPVCKVPDSSVLSGPVTPLTAVLKRTSVLVHRLSIPRQAGLR